MEELTTFFTAAVPSALEIVVLMGMLGSGKTEIALEYAYRMQEHYEVIIWLDASSRYQFADAIIHLLSMTDIQPPAQRSDHRRIFSRFRTWLRLYHGRFLLVLDHLEDPSLLNEVVEERCHGHILVTRAAYEIIDGWKTITVPPFTEEESVQFLLHRVGLLAPDEPFQHAPLKARHGACALHRAFGGHPLALDQAGAYLTEVGGDLDTFLASYRQHRRELLCRRGTAFSPHPLSVYETIALLCSNWAVRDLFFLYLQKELDCSDPYPIVPSTLRIPAQLRAYGTDPASLSELRVLLIKQFLLVPTEQGRWEIHPIVREVMHELLAFLKEHNRQLREQEDRYVPLTEEEIYQLLVEARGAKERLATLRTDDPETRELLRTIWGAVRRLNEAVLPGPRKQRALAQNHIEKRYTTVVPLLPRASDTMMRQYAKELFVLLHPQKGKPATLRRFSREMQQGENG